MKIFSPVATGNGAYVIHKSLEKQLTNYFVVPYNPYWTMVPVMLPLLFGNRAEIIHTTPDYACFFSRKNTPLIVTLHNYVLDPFMRPYSSTLQNIHYQTDLKWFIKRSLQQAAVVTSVSGFTAQAAKCHLPYDGDIRVIPNGVDTQLFYPRRIRRNTGKIKVLFSGNLTRRKGAQWLPRIAAQFNDNIELLYTQGLNNAKFRLSGDNVRCIGKVPYQEMPKLYHAVDMLLMPTVREGMSLAVLEAMACGLPVVVSHCSSMPELIEEGKGGFLCPIGDTQTFAEKVNRLAEDPCLRKTMGEFNRNIIEERFTLHRMLKGYQSLFEEVMALRT